MSTDQAPENHTAGPLLGLGFSEGLGPVLELLNKELPRNPPWAAGQYLCVELLGFILTLERRRYAKLCEDISDEYQRREGMKYPELKTDAQTGADDCVSAIRNSPIGGA
jgi:hypothetical protein